MPIIGGGGLGKLIGTRPGGGGAAATLLFEDNFDGVSIDPLKWSPFYYWGDDPPRNPGTGEIQTYTEASNVVSAGTLSIVCDKIDEADVTTGPVANTASSDLGFGDDAGLAWTNPGNGFTSNNVYATIVRSTLGGSNYFYCTGFDLSALDDDVVVVGLKPEIECKSSAATTYAIGSLIFVDGGINPSGASFTNADVVVPTVEAFIQAGGGPLVTNGADFTGADLKAAGWGFAFTVVKTAGATSQTFSVDSVRLTVYTSRITYTSGMISSYDTLKRTYGYFEAEIQTPAGPGFWPAFWLNTGNNIWPPEIDIAEFGGNEITHYYTNSIYSDPANPPDGTLGNEGYIDVNPTTAFHVYGLDWQSTYVRFYCDGIMVREITDAIAIPHEDLYIIINFAVGPGGWSLIGAVDGTTPFPSSTVVKYVRVWDVYPY